MKRKEAGHVRGVVDGLLRKWQDGTAKKGNAVMEAWIAATGKETAKEALPVNYKNGILTVVVENSTRMYELTLEKRNILARFNKDYTGRKKATDIRFRIGRLGEG